MNASYKIVLLGAFVLFAAVVGYYILSGDGPTPDELALNDDYDKSNSTAGSDDPAPNPRTTLDTTPPVIEPIVEPVVEPVVEEETIGETPDELPEVPVIGVEPGEDPLAFGDPVRPAPGPTEDPTTEDPATTEEETTDPSERPRLGPDEEPSGPIEETAEPEIEPEADPPTRPIPPDPASIPRTYTVQAGDTFASIAEKFYGEERAWFDIAQANPSIDPKRLQVGQSISLPNRQPTPREREEVQPPAPGQDQNYTVRPGDNLSKIAKKFYGDSEQWDLIYARNRKLIGPRPDALKVGMEIVIPQAYEGAE